MAQLRWAFLLVATVSALGQTSEPTIRVEVRTGADPIEAADVTLNGHRGRTGPDGVAILPGALGHVDVRVSKEGFFPAHASLDVDAVAVN